VDILTPTHEFQKLVHGVKKLITKREHKLVDFDRHRESQQKLEAKNRDITDEKKLGKVETQLSDATRDYNDINDLLIRELPILISLAARFIDPIFHMLYSLQLKVYENLDMEYRKICDSLGSKNQTATQFFAAYDQVYVLKVVIPRTCFECSRALRWLDAPSQKTMIQIRDRVRARPLKREGKRDKLTREKNPYLRMSRQPLPLPLQRFMTRSRRKITAFR
jgi:hypothetical protein